MPTVPSVATVERPELADALSKETRFVSLIGPRGCGKTTALADWAGSRSDAVWVRPGVPLPAAGIMVVDSAEDLTDEEWEVLREHVRLSPGLTLRMAAHSGEALPTEWNVEQVFVPGLTLEQSQQVLASTGSNGDPRLIQFFTAGHAGSVQALAVAGATTAEEIQTVLARAADPSSAVLDDPRLAAPHCLTPEILERLGAPIGVLDKAEREGWGSWSGPPAAVFRMVPSVRATYLSAGQHNDSASLHALAAETLLDHGAALPAFVEAVAAGRFDIADAALKAGGLAMIWDHGYELKTLLDPLPVSRLRSYPVLAFALAITYYARQEHRIRAAELFGLALLGARRHTARPEDRAVLRVMISVTMRLTGTRDGGVSAANHAAELLAELQPDERQPLRMLEPDLHLHTGISLLYGSQLSKATEQFMLALSKGTRTNTDLLSFGCLAATEALYGDVAEAQAWLGRARERSWPERSLNDYPGSMLWIAESLVALESFDFEAAEEALARIWHHRGTNEHWPLMAHARAYIDLGTGRPAAGLEQLRALRQRRGHRFPAASPTGRRLDALESLLCLATGDTATASSLTDKSGSDPAGMLAAARVMICTSAHEEALNLLSRLPHSPAPEVRMTRSTLLAVLFHRMGRPTDSMKAVAETSGTAHAYGIRTPLMTIPDEALTIFGELTAKVPRGLPEADPLPQLTRRERVVLAKLLTGRSVKEIADELFVSVHTVKSQRRSIYRKLGVSTREEALAVATSLRLLGETTSG